MYFDPARDVLTPLGHMQVRRAAPSRLWLASGVLAFLWGCGELLGGVDISNQDSPISNQDSSRAAAANPANAGLDANAQALPLSPVNTEGSGRSLPIDDSAPACVSGARRCEGSTLLVCDAEGATWTEEVCATSDLCEQSVTNSSASGCISPACKAGESRCNGAQIEDCDGQRGQFVARENAVCATPELCSAGADGMVACLAPVCDAEAFRCAGPLLQRCGEGRQAWLDVQSCASAELCDAKLGTEGCQAAACNSGELRCAGDTLVQCRVSRDGSDPVAECAQAGGCDPVALGCRDPCIVHGARCVGATLQTCDDVLVGWESRPCVSAELCNVEARSCDSPVCESGESRCSDTQPQACAPGRDAFIDVGSACATPELCDPVGPGCGAPACAPGEQRCNGAAREQCSLGRTGFEVVEQCASAGLCTSSGGAAACAPPACDAGETRCQGVTVSLTCNADRTGFDARTCQGLLSLCDPGPPATCRRLL